MRGEYERACTREPIRLSEDEKETVRHLAEDVPAIWHDGSTTPADRQMIARTMLERITLLVVGDSEMVEVECLWAGGVQTRHRLVRPVRRFEQLKNFDRLLARLGELRCQGLTADRMAERLNAEGWRPAKRASFNAPMVRRLLSRHGVQSMRPTWSQSVPREGDEEVTLQELASRLGCHRQTVYGRLRRGRLKGRLAQVGGQRIWLVKLRDAAAQHGGLVG